MDHVDLVHDGDRAGPLVLLRHGESTANAADVFAGWQDVPLTPRGEREAAAAGRSLVAHGLAPDVVHTSLLGRAVRTAELALDAAGLRGVPVRRTWRLNERHYGTLQGRPRAAVRAEVGDDLLQHWRRSYTGAPPPLPAGDPRAAHRDPRYRSVDPADLPTRESLADVRARLTPYWRDSVVPDLVAGRCVLLVSHGNALRALRMHLDGLGVDRVPAADVPTGVPVQVDLDAGCLPLVTGQHWPPLAPERETQGAGRS